VEDALLTRSELAQFDGHGGRPAYVAFHKKVYDVTASASWDDGLHYDEHHAGVDLTEAMSEAPHGDETLDDFPVVGRLVD